MDHRIRLVKNHWSTNSVSFKDVSLRKWSLGKEQAKWDDGILVQVEPFDFCPSVHAVMQVGASLITLLKDSAFIRIDRMTGKIMGQEATSKCANEPALKHEVVWQPKHKSRMIGVLSLHPAVIALVETHEAVRWTLFPIALGGECSSTQLYF